MTLFTLHCVRACVSHRKVLSHCVSYTCKGVVRLKRAFQSFPLCACSRVFLFLYTKLMTLLYLEFVFEQPYFFLVLKQKFEFFSIINEEFKF
jgi:hypothetical protein